MDLILSVSLSNVLLVSLSTSETSLATPAIPEMPKSQKKTLADIPF